MLIRTAHNQRDFRLLPIPLPGVVKSSCIRDVSQITPGGCPDPALKDPRRNLTRRLAFAAVGVVLMGVYMLNR